MKKVLFLFVAAFCCMTSFAQWTSDPYENTRVTLADQSNYGREVVTSEDGITYVISLVPGYNDSGDFCLSFRLQVLDKDGYITLPEEGLIISNERARTYTVTNQYLFVDNEGNAIIMAADCRNSASNYLGYTVYKVAVDGTVLWQKDLADSDVFYGCAAMKGIQTTDGGYAFAYLSYDENAEMTIHVEKLTNDGKVAWNNPVKMSMTKGDLAYPYPIDAGDNQIMLIYVTGSQIWAHMIDFDGSDVWGSDTQVYKGANFAGIPAWTFVEVIPGPDGGAIASWQDYKDTEGVYSNWISYIKNDGSYGYPNTSDAVRISYDDYYSKMAPKLYYDDNEKAVYAIYKEMNQGYQENCGIFVQKISNEGELLWGAEGKAIIDIQNNVQVGNATIQGADGSNVAIFYQTNNITSTNAQSYAMKLDKDGNYLWDEAVSFTPVECNKDDLSSSCLIDDNYWVLTWEDSRDNALYAQIITVDGIIGEMTSSISLPKVVGQGSLSIYNISGQLVKKVSNGSVDINSLGLTPGMYIVKNANSESKKILVK